MMDLKEFRADLLNEAAGRAESDQNFRHSSLVEVAVRYLADADEVADFEPCYYRGVGDRKRALAVDGYAFDGADASLRIFVADTTLAAADAAVPTLTKTDATVLFNRLRAFLEEAADGRLSRKLEESSPAYGLAVELAAKVSTLSRIRAYLLTDSVLSVRAKDWPEGKIAGVPLEFHIWDVARLHRVHTSRSGRDDLLVDFRGGTGSGLPCVAATTGSGEYAAYLCVVPGDLLAGVYEEYGSRLLEGNVRSFLMARGKVNKGIRNTVLHQPNMFFAYNNGIAATASAVSFAESASGLVLETATDLQIVNGAQTTASLAAARRDDRASLSGIHVPMKLSVVSLERAGEMVPLISRFANSQNKVSEADFFSNHDYHRRLEEISRRIWAPAQAGMQYETHWFYERTRGQYVNEALGRSADRRHFERMNPRNQLITKTELAKAENAWRGLPHTVSKGAQKNFVDFAAHITAEWERDADAFNEDYWRIAVGHVILFRALEKLISTQSWYSGGYRANVVAYSMAYLARIVGAEANSREVDFIDIWRRRSLSPALTAQLATIAEAMHGVITTPPPGVQNVTEWSKKEACWDRAKRSEVSLRTDLQDELVAASAVRERKKAARSLQQQDTGIDDQTRVVQLGHEYWGTAMAWATAHLQMPPGEMNLLRMAAGLTAYLPSDKQSHRLLQLKERLELEGLAPPVQSTEAGPSQ